MIIRASPVRTKNTAVQMLHAHTGFPGLWKVLGEHGVCISIETLS